MVVLYIYILIIVAVIIGLYILFRKDVSYINHPCNCELDRGECHQKTKITYGVNHFNMETDMNDTIKCGKVKKQLDELEKML